MSIQINSQPAQVTERVNQQYNHITIDSAGWWVLSESCSKQFLDNIWRVKRVSYQVFKSSSRYLSAAAKITGAILFVSLPV